jgi:hypothetical protein
VQRWQEQRTIGDTAYQAMSGLLSSHEDCAYERPWRVMHERVNGKVPYRQLWARLFKRITSTMYITLLEQTVGKERTDTPQAWVVCP